MPDLNDAFLAAFPEAAVLICAERIAAANPMARHYLPQLEPGAPVPAFFSVMQGTSARSGTFSVGLTTYSFSLTATAEGWWIFFRPAPQTALTDSQLDGVLRQLRQFMGELLVEVGNGKAPTDQAAFRKSYHRMFRLIRNLEFMADPAPKEVGFCPVTLDLAGLCRRVGLEAADLLAESGIELRVESELASLLIPGDGELLRRMLLELIANAARAAHGSVRLQLQLRQGRALLSVSHSGAPLTERQMAAMMQQDTDQQLPMPGTGAGLGLSIVRRIVELHSGTMLVDWGEGVPAVRLSLPAGPLDTRVTVRTPEPDRYGGLDPALVALSDVLPARLFEEVELG